MKKRTIGTIKSKTLTEFMAQFKRTHKKPRKNQNIALEAMPKDNKLIIQGQPGEGKTALGVTFLRTHCGDTENGIFICPSKTLVDGVVKNYPDIMPMYGRNEYPCLYYDKQYQADLVPCAMLKSCPHRVNLETGETYEQGAVPCPYLQAKYLSRKSQLVACTSHYYFFEALGREELPHAIVIDEVHQFANSLRSMMQYHITDYLLDEFWTLLESVECRTEARHIREFSDKMIQIIKQSESGRRTSLIIDEDLKDLLNVLLKLKRANIDSKIQTAISKGKIDPITDREILKQIDQFTGSLYNYVKSLEFALTTKDRKALTYVFGYWDKELIPGKKAQYTLTIRSYSISGLIKSKLLPENYMAMSATIGTDTYILEMETGITGKFINLIPDFPPQNTAIFMPTDTPNLSVKGSRRNDKNRTLRSILRSVVVAKKAGIRSLIIVISEDERKKCLDFAKEEGLVVMSYDNHIKPREAVQNFRNGIGDVLIGTETQYGEGIDLPGDIAGITFYFRPGYPSPDDPQAQFEEKRYGNKRWALWNWRVIMKLLQVRGRNVRSITDKGVTILISQQFNRFTFSGLPTWLQGSYIKNMTLDQSVKQAVKLLKNK